MTPQIICWTFRTHAKEGNILLFKYLQLSTLKFHELCLAEQLQGNVRRNFIGLDLHSKKYLHSFNTTKMMLVNDVIDNSTLMIHR